jgi:hypothetical protein
MRLGKPYVFFLLNVPVGGDALELLAQLGDFHVVLGFHDLTKREKTSHLLGCYQREPKTTKTAIDGECNSKPTVSALVETV